MKRLMTGYARSGSRGDVVLQFILTAMITVRAIDGLIACRSLRGVRGLLHRG